jgi:hypothetical protein
MLDRLPTELLLRTLELAAPLDYSPSFYLERRLLLRNCCLVFKRMYNIAQPMLSEVFEVELREDIEVLKIVEGDGKRRGDKVKVLALRAHVESYNANEHQISHIVELTTIAPLVPSVSDFRLLGEGTFDLSPLAALHGAFLTPVPITPTTEV